MSTTHSTAKLAELLPTIDPATLSVDDVAALMGLIRRRLALRHEHCANELTARSR